MLPDALVSVEEPVHGADALAAGGGRVGTVSTGTAGNAGGGVGVAGWVGGRVPGGLSL